MQSMSFDFFDPRHVFDVYRQHCQVLGKGAFGTVYLATDITDNREFACKSINKAKLVTEVRPVVYKL